MYDNGQRRTVIREYPLIFAVTVRATLSEYYFYGFITNTLAYTGLFYLLLYIFGTGIRRIRLDDQVVLNGNHIAFYGSTDNNNELEPLI